jgi:hypothetical protein
MIFACNNSFTGRIFGRVNVWLGIAGSTLMMLYVILVNFVPGVETMAAAFVMPGGLLLMTWMILCTIRLFKLKLVVKMDARQKRAPIMGN